MQGAISVRSQIGKGSIFRFEIDMEEGQENALHVKAESRHVSGLQPGQAPCRVLIADDKDDNRVLLSEMLGRIGFEVRGVVNGEQAVHEAETWHPHMILMDTRMPVMNGYEAIQRIRSGSEASNVKIISVTASAFDEDRKKALQVGADDFVGKPFREEVLLEKMRVLLEVEYTYDDDSAESAPIRDLAGDAWKAGIAALPDSMVLDLHNAVLAADMDRILELIGMVEPLDGTLAGVLRRLAEAFEYPQLLDMTTRPQGTE
jgi:CheY-like chemotaxis protein